MVYDKKNRVSSSYLLMGTAFGKQRKRSFVSQWTISVVFGINSRQACIIGFGKQ